MTDQIIAKIGDPIEYIARSYVPLIIKQAAEQEDLNETISEWAAADGVDWLTIDDMDRLHGRVRELLNITIINKQEK